MMSRSLNLTVCGVTFNAIKTANIKDGIYFIIEAADGSHQISGCIGDKVELSVNNYDPITTYNRSSIAIAEYTQWRPNYIVQERDKYLIDMFKYFLVNIRNLV